MRVVMVVPRFPVMSEVFLFRKAAALVERGINVRVVAATSPRSEWTRMPEVPGARDLRQRTTTAWPVRPRWLVPLLLPMVMVGCLLRAPATTVGYLRRGWNRFGFAGLLRRFYLDAHIIAARPDVVHFEFGTMAIERPHLGELLGAATVVSFRGYDVVHGGLSDTSTYREVWKNIDGLHFLGEDLRRRALRRGCPADRFYALIPPAVDAGDFERLRAAETSSGPTTLLSVGRLHWMKSYEDALQVVRLLLDSGHNVNYRIIGAGPHETAVRFAVRQLELVDKVSLLGARSSEEVRREMRRADLFLHTAVQEGFCNAVLEAQASGLPVVASDAGGLSENVVDGVTGLVRRRRDPQALAEAAGLLVSDPELRQTMGAAGRRRALTEFNLDLQIDRFLELYEAVMHGVQAA